MASIAFTTSELQVLAKQVAAILGTPPVVAPPVVTPPIVTPPGSKPPLLIFHNNVLVDTQGEYNFGSGRVDDSVLSPDVPGLKVILVTGDEGLQIRMPNDDFDSTGYSYVSVTLKAKQPNTTITTGAEEKGDITIPNTHGMFDLAPYAVTTDSNGFTTYHIPLSAYGIVNGLHVYKFAFLGNTNAVGGNAANVIEYSDLVIMPA